MVLEAGLVAVFAVVFVRGAMMLPYNYLILPAYFPVFNFLRSFVLDRKSRLHKEMNDLAFLVNNLRLPIIPQNPFLSPDLPHVALKLLRNKNGLKLMAIIQDVKEIYSNIILRFFLAPL